MVKSLFHINRPGEEKGEQARAVAVIGLGRFGQALALELMETGAEVLGIDRDPDIVQSLNMQLTHVVCADSSREQALHQLSIEEFDRVVVGIGSDLEASILTASTVLRMGVKSVWAKATSASHGAILDQLGVHHVIFPESEMGRRVAHLVRGDLLDYMEIEKGFVMVKAEAPEEVIGRPLVESRIRDNYGVTVVAVKTSSGEWTYATADTVLSPGDNIIIAGRPQEAETFGRT